MSFSEIERSVLGTKSFLLQYDSFQIGIKTNFSRNEIRYFIIRMVDFIADLKQIILQMLLKLQTFRSQNKSYHFRKGNVSEFFFQCSAAEEEEEKSTFDLNNYSNCNYGIKKRFKTNSKYKCITKNNKNKLKGVLLNNYTIE